MDMLLAGILLWSGVHYVPGFLPNVRASLIEKLGNGYRGLFSILIVASITLMVFGWRASTPEFIYAPLENKALITSILMILSFYLLGAANGPSNAKRYIRHPMLTGVIVWGGAHLLANGDSRSIILFGGMIIWAISEILIINKREGEWQKPAPSPIKSDIIKLIIAIVLYVGIVFAHPYIAGVPVMVS